MTDKPSRNEEEYFARREAELLRQSREVIEDEARKRERASHLMKCPKCGADLASEEYHGVQVDRCPECHGVWFDAGEVELVMAREEHGVGALLKAVMQGVRGAAPARPVEE